MNHYCPRAVMIHGVPVKTYNALQNHIIVLFMRYNWSKLYEKNKVILVSYIISNLQKKGF